MKINLMGLFRIKEVLSEHLLGVNMVTNERKKPDLRLPVSMKRHLRRLLEAVDDELKVADPDRVEFVNKWKVHGENKDELPKLGEIPDFDKEYAEMFFTSDIVLPFSPFKLELLDGLNEIIPDDIEGLMTEMNSEFEKQQKEIADAEKSAGVSDSGASTPKTDAD